MPLRAPRTRARVGEQRAPGDVRPVTTRSLVGISVALIVVVAIAIGAIIWASGSPKTKVDATNLPSTENSDQPATSTATYRETVEVPGDGSHDQVVPAQLSLRCAGICRDGTLTGYLGTFTLTAVFGANTTLTGTLNGSCETITLTPQDELSAAPQILTGTITRPDNCTNSTAKVATPINLRLDRT